MENDRKKYSLNRLSQKQWADYKSIRLEALLAEPDKFGSSYDMQCSCIIVSHRAGNDASKAANQRFGFSFTHLETTVWPDGKLDNEVFYKLDL